MNSLFQPGLAWTRQGLMAWVLCLLALCLAAAPHAAAATAAGTVIGNQATASYVDATGTARNAASNLVQTTVSQVKNFALSASGAKTAAPGQTVYYPHTITNTGNGSDTYALTAPVASGTIAHTSLVYYIDANSDGVPDNFTAITSTGPLPAGGQFSFVVAGVVPSTAAATQTGLITVGASDTGSNSYTNADTTTVANSVINVTQALSSTSGAAGASVTVTLSYTNSGTLDATNLTLIDALPSGMTYVPNSGRWSGSGTTVLTDVSDGLSQGVDYSYTGASTTLKAIIPTVPVGTSGTLTFNVTIGTGLAPTTSANAGLTTNTATYTTTTQTVAANTNSVPYTVRQSAAVVFSGNAATSADSTPAVQASAGQGATLTFLNYVWNTGNGSDTFNLAPPTINTFPDGTRFAMFRSDGVTSVLDSNGDGVPDTGPLASGASFAVVIKVYLPLNAPTGAGPYTLRLSASSVFDPTRSDSVDNALSTIVVNSVDLTNGAALGAGGVLGTGPGTAAAIVTNSVTPNSTAATQTRFALWVNNTSPVADSYSLSVTSALPTGWSVSFAADCTIGAAAITSTGTIAAAGNQAVCAVVNVPATNTGNAPVGNVSFTFKAQSAVNNSTFDSIVDQVTVLALHSLSLTPNGTQQTFPGGAVTYTHKLSNNGNGSESVTFPGFLTDSQAAAGWTSVLYIDTGDNVLVIGTDTLVNGATSHDLAANASVTLFVRVFAPGSATSTSPADVSTLTATYSGATATASDSTTVTDGLLLLKEQQASDCTATPSGTYSNAAIAAGAATAPGKCIAYRITATNTTASTINTVVVSDIVPANTTLYLDCGAPAQTGGSSVGGSATTAGSTGNVTATAATLASGASFQLTFCARINP